MRYALVENDVVVNVILLNGPTDYVPVGSEELHPLDDGDVGVGWLRSEGSWAPPPEEPTEPPSVVPSPPIIVGANGTAYAIAVNVAGLVVASPVTPSTTNAQGENHVRATHPHDHRSAGPERT